VWIVISARIAYAVWFVISVGIANAAIDAQIALSAYRAMGFLITLAQKTNTGFGNC
jgi:hypothetical protein